MATARESEFKTDDEALWAAIMSDETVDEVSVRPKNDGRVFLRWRYAEGPYHYRWFNFNR